MHVYASNEYMYKEQNNPETINFPRHYATTTTNKFLKYITISVFNTIFFLVLSNFTDKNLILVYLIHNIKNRKRIRI